MADLAPVAGSVIHTAPTTLTGLNTPFLGLIGETFVQGDVAYLDLTATPNKWMKASANSQAAAKAAAVALAAGSNGQTISFNPINGEIDFGVTLGVTVDYYLSINAGKICLYADITAGGTKWVTKIGRGRTTAKMVMDIEPTDLLKP